MPENSPPPTLDPASEDEPGPAAEAPFDQGSAQPQRDEMIRRVRSASSGPNQLVLLATRFVVGVLLLVVAIGIFMVMQASKPTVQEVDPAAARQTVVVFEAQRLPVQRQWRGYGTAEALNTADVPARVTATVESIPLGIRPGARVEQDQLLVQLDGSDFERELEIAQQRIAELDASLAQLAVEEKRITERLTLEATDVEIAQTEFDRQVRFRERNVGNQQDLDTARRNLINAQRNQLLTREAADLIGPRRLSLEAQIASQQSQVDLAELNRQRTTIVSPIDGVLQSIDIEVGENLAAGQTIARVVALSPIEVPIRVPASARATLAVGDRVILRPTSGPADARTWTTTLSRIAPEEDAATRTLTVYADLTADDQTNGLLPSPGMFLEASVWVATAEDRFLVPRRAIRAGRIQVAQNGEVVSQPVDVAYTLSGLQSSFGLPDDQWSVIDDVLEEGDLVIVNAATQVPDGTAVEAKPVNGDSAKASLGAPAVNDGSSDFSEGATP
ncbi:MAG: efflux RND transporter periplasmic adaptor subunit [Planctomycetota bacterium]